MTNNKKGVNPPFFLLLAQKCRAPLRLGNDLERDCMSQTRNANNYSEDDRGHEMQVESINSVGIARHIRIDTEII